MVVENGFFIANFCMVFVGLVHVVNILFFGFFLHRDVDSGPKNGTFLTRYLLHLILLGIQRIFGGGRYML